MAAATRDLSIRQYVLAAVWDNPQDAAYDRL
jgi:hypothetical protein